MLIGGFWHGADWRFVFWGLAHGLALAIHKLWSKYFGTRFNFKYSNVVYTLITFHFVGLCWIFFRATSFDTAFLSIERIFSATSWTDFLGFWLSRPETSLIMIFAAVIVFIPWKTKESLFGFVRKLPAYAYIVLMLIALQIIVQFKDEIVQPFIYFQF
jgi:D-alanyl-lipoteichoic acid acyltransferase DltB (MBOAT superfamily)